jgi:5-methylcytosine-specific restriction enzyme A
MPKHSPRPCAQHGCGELVYDGSRCVEHQLPRAPDKRPSSTVREYGYDWKTKVRDPYLKVHPWCVNLYGTHWAQLRAVVVDHILPKEQGGTDDWSNLQGLCRSCDNKKHYDDGSMRGGGKKRYQSR